MKSSMRSLLLVLALSLGTSVPAQAQTFAQSFAAYKLKDYRTAFAGFKKLAEQEDAMAQGLLGLMYEYGQGVTQNDRLAAEWYRRAADNGDSSAQLNLGLMYANGNSVPKDQQQAVIWYSKSAEQGNAVAQYELGWMYRNGQGVATDDQLAVAWFRKAADQGNVRAQYDLGWMYGNGRGVPKDDRQAAAWYRKSAEQGSARAQGILGAMYADGSGLPKDEQLAVAWYRKAAEQGQALAQYALGLMYGNGRGVPKDDQQAAMWHRKAAEQGVTLAQGALGAMYAVGEGVAKDEQIAYFWWLLASAEGDQNAIKLRDFVEPRLSPVQRAAAQADARNWQPKTAAQTIGDIRENAAGIGGTNSSPTTASPLTAQADSTGSGFRVGRGVVVTNHHVTDGCSRLRVNGAAAQLRSSDARNDLALLGVVSPGPIVSFRSQRAAVGEPVAVAGFPLRGLLSGFNMTTGNLSSLSGVGGDTRLVQITAPVQPGNSGGPMLDAAGNLMGIVVSKLDALKTAKLTGDIPQNVNFAINVNVLRTFLDANGVVYESANSDKALAPTAVADKARGFTVLVECWK